MCGWKSYCQVGERLVVYTLYTLYTTSLFANVAGPLGSNMADHGHFQKRRER